MKRRDFLGLGLGLGTLLIASCSGSGRPGSPGGGPLSPLPGSFRFSVALSGGDALPGGGSLARLPGTCFSTDDEVFFMARDTAGVMGMYAGAREGSGLGALRSVIRQGDTLPDGTVVASFSAGRVSGNGDYATVVTDPLGIPAVFGIRGGQPAERLLSFAEAFRGDLPGANLSRFQRASFDRSGHLMVVASHSVGVEGRSRQGLFLFPGGLNSDAARLLLMTGQPAPGSEATVHRFGIHDTDGGFYAVQVDLEATAGGPVGQGIVVGDLAGAARLGVAPTGVPGALRTGRAPLAPRIDASGRTAFVIAESDARRVLEIGGSAVAATGDPSPSGRLLDGFICPILAPDGLAWFLAGARGTPAAPGDATEFLVTNGAEIGRVLALGQVVEGRRLEDLRAGTWPQQAAPDGTLAMVARMDGTPVILMGGPA